MTESSPFDYSLLDRPEVSNTIFHPRTEWESSSRNDDKDHLIEVASGIRIGARFHMGHPKGMNTLFFHGNGEIVADYDDLSPMYSQMGINFLVVDYRGYGRSEGEPTASAMMNDCHQILSYVRTWLKNNSFTGPLVVMGRSLGSASALELAAEHTYEIEGLIIESGFAYSEPLLRLLGVDVDRIGFQESMGFRNADKISRFAKPTLIIHAEYDHIIPYTDGQALYQSSPAKHKQLLKIDDADHNTILSKGLEPYMQAIYNLSQHILSSQ